MSPEGLLAMQVVVAAEGESDGGALGPQGCM